MKQINFGYLLFISFVAALGGFLFGYDTAVISGTISQVTEQFGLSSLSSGWYVGCALIGSIGGVAVGGMLGDWLGRRNAMLLSAVMFTASAAGCALCGSFDALVVWRIVGGVGIGVASIICPLYIYLRLLRRSIADALYRSISLPSPSALSAPISSTTCCSAMLNRLNPAKVYGVRSSSPKAGAVCSAWKPCLPFCSS